MLTLNKLAKQLLHMQWLVMQLSRVLGVGILVPYGGVVIGAGGGPLQDYIAP